MKEISIEIQDLKYEIEELKKVNNAHQELNAQLRIKLEQLKHNNQQIIDNCYNLDTENKTISKILDYAIKNNKILRDKD